jgi:RNA polymerase sigma-70 factor, ECF subfamily
MAGNRLHIVTGIAVTAAGEFDTLYERHGREVWAVAYARRLDSALAMDIAQEAFLRLWRECQSGTRIDNPRAWLLRVARNLAEDTAKSAFRRNGTTEPDLLQGVVGDRDPDAEPLGRLVQAELHATVREVLQGLPPADRDVLTLKYALDYDATAIAQALEIQASAVHMRLSRARQRLADQLKRVGVEATS